MSVLYVIGGLGVFIAFCRSIAIAEREERGVSSAEIG